MTSDISSVTADMTQTINMANKAFENVWSSIATAAKEIDAVSVSNYAIRKTISYNPYNNDVFINPELKSGAQMICDIINKNLQEVQKNTNYVQGWFTLGQCYLLLSDYANAYSAFSHVLRINNQINNQINEPYFWYYLGCVYQHFKFYDDALKYFITAKDILKNSEGEVAGVYHLRLAFIYRALRQFPEAYAEFDAVLKSPPKNLTQDDINFQKTYTLLLESKNDAALQEFKKFVQKYPHNLKVLQQYCWILSFKDDRASMEEIQQLIAAHSEFQNDPLLKFILARIELKNSNMESAYKRFCDIIVDWCDSAVFWCELGVLYFKNEQIQDAMVAFQRALYQKPQIAEAWLNLGLIFEKINEAESAKRLYEAGKSNCPNSQKLIDRLNKLSKDPRMISPDEQPEEIKDPKSFQMVGEIQELNITRTPPKIPATFISPNPTPDQIHNIDTLSMDYESLFA